MAVPNKPEKGDFNWDVTLNAALDWLDERIDGIPAGDSAYEVALENGFEGTEQEWLDSLVGEGGSGDTGDITFDGVKIIGAGTASGDGADLGTIELVPDGSLTSDQYLIIDPTAPNHIHIRAGGEQDNSSADLILGGEDTNLLVSDTGDYVDIRTTLEEATNIWRFGSDGYLTGPAMGGLFVSGLLNGESDLWLSSNDNVVLTGYEGGEFIGNADFPDNQIATVGDLGSDTEFTVVGGTLGTQPTFTGAPLFTGSYVKTGPMVHFQIQVDMDNITSFGTGQYYVDLPFPVKYDYQFRAGCLHDIGGEDQFAISGHVAVGESRVLLQWTNSSGQDEAFTATAPVTLQTNDNFHISGDYIIGGYGV